MGSMETRNACGLLYCFVGFSDGILRINQSIILVVNPHLLTVATNLDPVGFRGIFCCTFVMLRRSRDQISMLMHHAPIIMKVDEQEQTCHGRQAGRFEVTGIYSYNGFAL
jgi:hypothetical protein